MKLLLPNTDKHAPVKKRTIRAPWIDEELKNCVGKEMGQNEWLISLAAHLTG